jgi:hypothetical protein
MITVKIGPMQRDYENADANWVHRMIQSLRKSDEGVCVIVTIEEPPINISLASKECNRSGHGSTNFNEKEKKIIEFWRKHLGEDEVVPGRLISFLSELGRFVG